MRRRRVHQADQTRAQDAHVIGNMASLPLGEMKPAPVSLDLPSAAQLSLKKNSPRKIFGSFNKTVVSERGWGGRLGIL